eukprot:scaffold336_cov372-Pavlova_lutheri.AAC.10
MESADRDCFQNRCYCNAPQGTSCLDLHPSAIATDATLAENPKNPGRAVPAIGGTCRMSLRVGFMWRFVSSRVACRFGFCRRAARKWTRKLAPSCVRSWHPAEPLRHPLRSSRCCLIPPPIKPCPSRVVSWASSCVTSGRFPWEPIHQGRLREGGMETMWKLVSTSPASPRRVPGRPRLASETPPETALVAFLFGWGRIDSRSTPPGTWKDPCVLTHGIPPTKITGEQGTPPPLFLHRERGGVAVGSVEPPEDPSRRCCPNRSCRALCVEGFGSMDPGLVRPVQEQRGPCTSQGLSGLDPASFPLAGAPSFRRAYLFEYRFKWSKRWLVVGTPNGTAAAHLPEGSRAPTGNQTAKPGEGKDRMIGNLHEKNEIESRCSWCHEAHVQPPGQNAQKRVNLENSPSQPRRYHREDKRSRTNQAQIRILLVESPGNSTNKNGE